MNPLRLFLNQRRWNQQDLDSLTIFVRHRGAPADEREVPGRQAIPLTYGISATADPGLDTDEDCYDGEVFIPYHRILRVTNRAGEVLWTKPAEV